MVEIQHDENPTSTNLDNAKIQQEYSLRRYEARLGFWKVVLGTFIVGLAGVLIPGAIEAYKAHFDLRQKEAQSEFVRQQANQQYVKDFFDTAVNQDIELRVRFASYFESLSEGEFKNNWKNYHSTLIATRDESRRKINELSERLFNLERANVPDDILVLRTRRELAWARLETGYVEVEKGGVSGIGNLAKKARLYRETLTLVKGFTTSEKAIHAWGDEYKRFWQLYNTDLIGVESRDVARLMIEFGKELTKLAKSGDKEFSTLSEIGNRLSKQIEIEIE